MSAQTAEYLRAVPSRPAPVGEPAEAAAVADRLMSAALGALDILAIALGERLGYYRLLAHREALTPPGGIPAERACLGSEARRTAARYGARISAGRPRLAQVCNRISRKQ